MPSGSLSNGYLYYNPQQWIKLTGVLGYPAIYLLPQNACLYTLLEFLLLQAAGNINGAVVFGNANPGCVPPFLVNAIQFPGFGWSLSAPTQNRGWWFSVNQDYSGLAGIIPEGAAPSYPRGFDEISAFATSSTGMMGGTPSVIWNNYLIFAEGGYGSGNPTIGIFDGTYSYTIATIPNTTGGSVPIGIIGMLAANGIVYLTTLDSGSSDANWSGRIFSLNPNTGQLQQLGLEASFPGTGQIPYCLAWHLGKLWCGTMVQTPSNQGIVAYIAPNIDADWTVDNNAVTAAGGICSLCAFAGDGKLYVGTTAPASTFATIVVRTPSTSAYATSLTPTGGAAQANNGFLALSQFGGNLYASFWNPDTPNVSEIYRRAGGSWTKVFTGAAASSTNVPYILFSQDQTTLLAIGGGLGVTPTLLSTMNGTSWTNETSNLPVISGASVAALPSAGVVIS